MRNWMFKFAQFMQGRYGNDPLNRFLSIVSLIIFLVSMFCMGVPVIRFFYWIAIAMFLYQMFRTFSRNIEARRRECEIYLSITNRLRGFFGIQKRRWDERAEYAYFTCPNCKVQVRVPRGKGKIQITCPKCKAEFIKKT